MFQFIKIISNKFMQNNSCTLLGRWNHLTCKKQLTNRVRQANEDHCGVCVKNYREKNHVKKKVNHSKNDEEYLRVFCM